MDEIYELYFVMLVKWKFLYVENRAKHLRHLKKSEVCTTMEPFWNWIYIIFLHISVWSRLRLNLLCQRLGISCELLPRISSQLHLCYWRPTSFLWWEQRREPCWLEWCFKYSYISNYIQNHSRTTVKWISTWSHGLNTEQDFTYHAIKHILS